MPTAEATNRARGETTLAIHESVGSWPVQLACAAGPLSCCAAGSAEVGKVFDRDSGGKNRQHTGGKKDSILSNQEKQENQAKQK